MPGKLDWLAYGLPVERAQRNGQTLIDCLERNVPTAKMTETIGAVLPRLENSKFRVLPVINDCDVLLGLIADRPSQNVDLDAPVSEVMSLGPTTMRPYTPVEDAVKKLGAQTHAIPVTSSDGKLMGLFTGGWLNALKEMRAMET